MPNTTDPVEVYRAADTVEAYAVHNALEEAGIEAMVVGEGLEFAQGAVPMGDSTAPRVLVRQERKNDAQLVVERWRSMQREHAAAEPRRPFQFGMSYILVNVTLIAVLLGIASPLGFEGFIVVAWPLFCLLLFGNLLYLAFERRRHARRE